jgi:hypothetical protein
MGRALFCASSQQLLRPMAETGGFALPGVSPRWDGICRAAWDPGRTEEAARRVFAPWPVAESKGHGVKNLKGEAKCIDHHPVLKQKMISLENSKRS